MNVLEEFIVLKPLGDRVLVKVDQEEEKEVGGIVLTSSAKEKPQEGSVKAVGEGNMTPEGKKVELSVKVGDKVMFDKYAGTEVKVDGEDYLIMHEKDIMGIVE